MKNAFKFGTSFLIATGIFGFAGSAPANAAACPAGSVEFQTLTLSFTCTQGGFTFTLNSKGAFNPMDAISFSNPASDQFNYTVQANTPWNGGPYVLGYSVTAPTGQLLSMHTASLSSATIPKTSGNFAINSASGNTTATLTNNNAIAGDATYATNVATENYTGTLTYTSGLGIQSIQSSYVTVPASTNGVPAPLPLLGAGAAFGFSRKLRRRIKLAA